MLFKHLGNNRDGGVDRVGDDKDERVRASRCDSDGEIPDDASIDLINGVKK